MPGFHVPSLSFKCVKFLVWWLLSRVAQFQPILGTMPTANVFMVHTKSTMVLDYNTRSAGHSFFYVFRDEAPLRGSDTWHRSIRKFLHVRPRSGPMSGQSQTSVFSIFQLACRFEVSVADVLAFLQFAARPLVEDGGGLLERWKQSYPQID